METKATDYSNESTPVREQEMKIIWILSWSWPEAWVAITNEIHWYLQDKYGAVDDLDYPDYILYNKPLRGFWVTWIERPELVEQDFVEAMKKLDWMWAEVIWIACNTLHALLEKVESSLDAEVVHMVHETCKEVDQYDNILVLCSATTTRTQLYEWYLKEVMWKSNVLTLQWDSQKIVDDVIESAMWWNQSQKEIDAINKVIAEYESKWDVDAVILWCTELPLAYSEENCHLPVASSNNVLAKRLVERAKA